VVGTQALIGLATRLLAEFPDSVLGRAEVTIAAIEDAALADDPLALRVVHMAAESLGIAVAGLLNLTNPAAVILGGGLSRLGERLVGPLRESVHRRTFVSSMAASEILTSQLGPRGFAIGAATLVLDAALTDPNLFPTIGAR
jgi:predicted NBD/HSP70 family sugar kinase